MYALMSGMIGIMSPWAFLVRLMFVTGTGLTAISTVIGSFNQLAITNCLARLENKTSVAAALGAAYLENGVFRPDPLYVKALELVEKNRESADDPKFWESLKQMAEGLEPESEAERAQGQLGEGSSITDELPRT